jgi:hypothetical protein
MPDNDDDKIPAQKEPEVFEVSSLSADDPLFSFVDFHFSLLLFFSLFTCCIIFIHFVQGEMPLYSDWLVMHPNSRRINGIIFFIILQRVTKPAELYFLFPWCSVQFMNNESGHVTDREIVASHIQVHGGKHATNGA